MSQPAASGRPRRVALADAGDALAAVLAAALGEALAGAASPAAPPGAVRWELQRSSADPPRDAEALVLLPRRATPRRLSEDALAAGDRALVEIARRWAAERPGADPAEGPGRAGRLILVSSALVHEPSHRHPGHLSEDRLARRPPVSRVSRRWRAIEAAVAAAAGGGGSPVVLRPAPVPVAGGDDVFSRLLTGPVSLAPAGFDPPLQLLAVDELAAAVAAALAGELAGPSPRPPTAAADLPASAASCSFGPPQRSVTTPASASRRNSLHPRAATPPRYGPGEKNRPGAGVWHVAPDGVVPLRRALRRAGVLRLPVPTAALRWRQRLRGGEPDAVAALCYPVTVDDGARRRAMRRRRPELPPATLERPAGELADDPFSLDPGYVARLGRTLFRFLHDVWWRIEWRGVEHLPRRGGAVLVGNHRGHQPWDGVMILHRLVRDLGRHPRFLIHPALAKFPFLTPYLARCGGIHACRENGDWVLSQGELLAVFPEGIQGAFTRYRDAYRLLGFRRDYVRWALRHQVPIVPLVVVGSAEIFPILAKIRWHWWQRYSEWPCLPITPTMSLVPLPSKWHVEVLEPFDVASHHPPEAADDPEVVRALDAEVRRRMAETLAALHHRRPGVFFGSMFGERRRPAG